MGAWVGASFGGPIGAILGAVAGHYLSNKQTSEPIGPSRNDLTIAYVTTLFAVFAKMAKVDGVISSEEIKALETFMRVDLELDEESRDFAVKVFREAKDNNTPAQDYLRQYAELTNYQRDAAQSLILLLHRLALADGVLHDQEYEFLRQTAATLRIPVQYIDHITGRASSSQRQHGQPVQSKDLKHCYNVLGINDQADEKTIRNAYRQKCKENHPDRLVSQGVPESMLKYANAKMAEISDAYNTIMQHKGYN